VVGIVVGSRKCGTTWLYENFLKDPDVVVSRKVKESGFFAREGELDFGYYEGLFPESPGRRVEVDSSLAYSDLSSRNIYAYNPQMRIALILRDPVEYAVSRYLHMRRKDQLSPARISDLVSRDGVLLRELDYASMLARFDEFRRLGSLLVIPYGLLVAEPARFYETVKRHLVGSSGSGFRPARERVNVSRSSQWSFMTGALSRAARAARSRGMHAVVNFAKGLMAHKLLERELAADQVAALRKSVSQAVMTRHGASVELYRRLAHQFAVDPE